MPTILPTGLIRGDASRIARRHNVALQTVLEIARGNRPNGRPAIHRTVAAYRIRNMRLYGASFGIWAALPVPFIPGENDTGPTDG